MPLRAQDTVDKAAPKPQQPIRFNRDELEAKLYQYNHWLWIMTLHRRPGVSEIKP